MNLQEFYDLAPVWLQNTMCSVKGWMISRRRYNKEFFSELERYEKGYYLQAKEMVRMLFSIKDMDVYKPYLSDVDWCSLKQEYELVYPILNRFPIINKEIVKRNLNSFINPAFVGKKMMAQTSGTTGGGLVFPYSVEMEHRQWAVWWRYRRSLGIQMDYWCGWFGGRTIISINNQRPPYWRVNKLGRQVMYSMQHLSHKTIRDYYEDLQNRRLIWLHGYPSSISLLASLITESRLDPLDCVKWITTGAENLLENHIATIQKAFPNAIVRTHYGLSEGVANFSQTIEGNWRIDSDFSFPEFVPIDESDRSICRIVGTGFSNLVFPLIRYDTGDLAKIEWVNGTPIIKDIYGRLEDYIELPNGVKLGRLDHIFKKCINVREAQIHQIRKDLIELRVVKEVNYTEQDEALLLQEASSRFGNEVELKITYCNRIERTKAGKIRFVISDLKC